MPSGLVFVAIVVIWAVILAPRAVRLYERGASARTAHRFRSAMTALAGTTSKPAARVVHTSTKASETAHAGQRSRVPSGAIGRRRRAMLVFGSVPIVVAPLVLIGALPVWVMFPTMLPLGSFAIACLLTPLPSSPAPTQVQTSDHVTDSQVIAVPSTRRRIAPTVSAAAAYPAPTASLVFAAADLSAFRSRTSAPGAIRPGAWAKAKDLPPSLAVVEQDLAIASTYESVEAQLGLEHYVASPSEVDGVPYRRAANQ
jgi:hypothetical protein